MWFYMHCPFFSNLNQPKLNRFKGDIKENVHDYSVSSGMV